IVIKHAYSITLITQSSSGHLYHSKGEHSQEEEEMRGQLILCMLYRIYYEQSYGWFTNWQAGDCAVHKLKRLESSLWCMTTVRVALRLFNLRCQFITLV